MSCSEFPYCDQGGPLARAARAGGPWPPPAPVFRPAQRRPRATQRATPIQRPTRHSQHRKQSTPHAPPIAAGTQRQQHDQDHAPNRPAIERRLGRAAYMASRPPTAALAVVRVGTASGEGGVPGHEAGRSSSPVRCGRPPYCRRHGCGCVSRRAAPDVAGGEQLLPRGGSARRGRSASVPVSLWLASVSSTHRASPASSPPRRVCLALAPSLSSPGLIRGKAVPKRARRRPRYHRHRGPDHGLPTGPPRACQGLRGGPVCLCGCGARPGPLPAERVGASKGAGPLTADGAVSAAALGAMGDICGMANGTTSAAQSPRPGAWAGATGPSHGQQLSPGLQVTDRAPGRERSHRAGTDTCSPGSARASRPIAGRSRALDAVRAGSCSACSASGTTSRCLGSDG